MPYEPQYARSAGVVGKIITVKRKNFGVPDRSDSPFLTSACVFLMSGQEVAEEMTTQQVQRCEAKRIAADAVGGEWIARDVLIRGHSGPGSHLPYLIDDPRQEFLQCALIRLMTASPNPEGTPVASGLGDAVGDYL